MRSACSTENQSDPKHDHRRESSPARRHTSADACRPCLAKTSAEKLRSCRSASARNALSPELVHGSTGRFRKPIRDPRKQREDRAGCDDIMEMRDHVVSVVQVKIG